MASARVRLREPNGRVFTIVEYGAAVDDVIERITARLAITSGTVVPNTGAVSEDADFGAAATGSYSDVTIVANDADGNVKTLNLENVINTIGNATTGAVKNPPPPELVTYLAAKGLTFVSGRFRR